MTENEVKSLMRSSQTPEEWDKNASAVKDHFGGHYPEFWYDVIILSGVQAEFQFKNRKKHLQNFF